MCWLPAAVPRRPPVRVFAVGAAQLLVVPAHAISTPTGSAAHVRRRGTRAPTTIRLLARSISTPAQELREDACQISQKSASSTESGRERIRK